MNNGSMLITEVAKHAHANSEYIVLTSSKKKRRKQSPWVGSWVRLKEEKKPKRRKKITQRKSNHKDDNKRTVLLHCRPIGIT